MREVLKAFKRGRPMEEVPEKGLLLVFDFLILQGYTKRAAERLLREGEARSQS